MRSVVLLTLILLSISATAQNDKQDSLIKVYNARMEEKAKSPYDTTVYMAVTRSASYPGGNEKMKAFITENLKYPSVTKTWKGEIYIQLVVENDGSLTNVKIVKGASEPYNNEAIAVVKKMPKWEPAQLNDMPKRMQYAIGVKFK